jgi:hypothetical protein
VHRAEGASAVIANNILAFGSLGIALDPASSASIVHNDVFSNRNPFVPGPTGDYVGLPDLTGIDGNISEDPLFMTSGHEDAELGPGSPALDAGANELAASALDLAGGPRLVDASGGGTPVLDLGAQEYDPGQEALRRVQLRVESRSRPGRFGLESVLLPRESIQIAILSEEDFDAVAEVDRGSLTLMRWVPFVFDPTARCHARDVDEDGDDDLSCRFPFAVLGATRSVGKRVLLFGKSVDGSQFLGVTRVSVLFLPADRLR